MLRLTRSILDEMVAHCLVGLPDEACGLLGGDLATATVDRLYLSENVARSALVYTIDPTTHLRADRDAQARGAAIVGVFHSHTHTEAHPSPTDVAQAPDPDWHYVIVSLRAASPAVRSYTIVDGEVAEEQIELA